MNQPDDLARLRSEYADRARRFAGRDDYSAFNRANLFTIQSRQRAVVEALRRQGLTDLSRLRVLEMGCGGGGVLTEFLALGARPASLFGVDLLFDRLASACERLPGSRFVNADGSRLPFPARSFDILLQFTALSSILDADLRRGICRDLLRVLKPSGLILWYDFWLNPTNPQTRGIRPAEIKQLFPNCRCEFRKITLAPPIARKLAPVSWGLCYLLESLKIFNTHYLAAIRPLPPAP